MSASPTILDALDHPALFGPHFAGPSWDRWRVFLGTLFGLPLDAGALDVFRQHTGRATAPTTQFREAAVIIGRSGGKSRVLALVAVYLAMFRDYEPFLAPGEVATVAVIAAARDQAGVIFRYIQGLLRAIPSLAGLILDDTADTITLSNRVTIEVATASFRLTRGRTFAAVLADETAYWRDESFANPDTEIFRAIRPGFRSIPGILLQASSPYRKSGVLFDTWRRHFGRDDARVLVWRGTTLEMNPSMDMEVIAEAYEDDPAAAAAEYGAEFRDDISDFVAREVVTDCVIPGRRELLPVARTLYSAFVDPSGGSSDSMTLAVAHREGDIAVLDAIREVRPPFSPEQVVTDFTALLKSYGCASVTGDRFAGEWAREPFRLRGVRYDISERVKNEIYRDALPLLNSRKLQLLDWPRLVNQLCGLERRTARGGRDSIDHTRGGHDDIANAALGALLSVSAAPAPYSISQAAVAGISGPNPWRPGASGRW